MNELKFSKIEEALKEIAAGHMIIVVDDEDRENEGDLVMAAEKISAEAINFMAKVGRGLICVPLSQEDAKRLELSSMVQENTASLGTAFTITVDASQGISTGISAQDRAHTVKLLASKQSGPNDFVRPGHIFPLIGKKGGVIRRAGHTEAAIDLARLAGLAPVGVICEILNDDGTMARRDDLFLMAEKYHLKIITIKDLIHYSRKKEKLVERIEVIDFKTSNGDFKLHLYQSAIHENENPVALVKGDVTNGDPVLVRVHSQCLTGDVFGSKRCDCREQMEKSLELIEKEGRGVFLYMQQEGRGIGLVNKIKAYKLQEQGHDTVTANQHLGLKADLRDYGVGAQILVDLGVKRIRLLTNNPRKIIGLEAYDLEVVERVSIETNPNEVNLKYLSTKRDKLGHMILGEEIPLQ